MLVSDSGWHPGMIAGDGRRLISKAHENVDGGCDGSFDGFTRNNSPRLFDPNLAKARFRSRAGPTGKQGIKTT